MEESLFKPIGSQIEYDESGVTEIESVCPECRKNGITKLLLTEIPFYKKVVVVSFECKNCGNTNNELQSVSEIQDKAIIYTIKCQDSKDLNRKVVKTEWAEIRIPEIEFEITKQTGLITTIEGIIDRAIFGLQHTIKNSDIFDSENLAKISNFVCKLNELKEGNTTFTFILDDVSGNSFVENPLAPNKDPNLTIKYYSRSFNQNKLLGIVVDDGIEEKNPLLDSLSQQEVLQFPTNCSNCNSSCFTNMKVTEIPHFKEIVLMVTLCDRCGYKTNEIKSAGGMEPKGTKHIKKINSEQDLNLDLVKSDTCSVIIPELDLHLDSNGKGRYTTIEGLVKLIQSQLKESNPFLEGDSEEKDSRDKFNNLIASLDDALNLTIILDDPCGNSFIDKPDEKLEYKRTNEQNEELGLNDMKTENY